MRILMISGEYAPHTPGGTGRHVTELIAAFNSITLDNESVIIDLVTPRFFGGQQIEMIASSIIVHRIDMPLIVRDFYNQVIERNQIFVSYANALMRQHKYDLIHVHDWFPATAGIALKDQWGIPLIVTIHGTMQGRYQGKFSSSFDAQIDLLEQKICHEAECIIVCSQFMSQEIQTCFGVSHSKINVIFNGVNRLELKGCSTEELAMLRRQYAPDGQKILFFIGRIVYEKGPHILIQAMQKILVNHPYTRLLIAGDSSNKLLSLAYELSVEKAVYSLDQISDRQRNCFYQIADAAIIPSLYEPFGMVALEAMSAGCNVIASYVGGLGEVVRHMENGLTVPPNDADSIVHAVNQLFADPISAQKRCMLALHEIDTKYQWNVIAAQTRQVYQSTVRV